MRLGGVRCGPREVRWQRVAWGAGQTGPLVPCQKAATDGKVIAASRQRRVSPLAEPSPAPIQALRQSLPLFQAYSPSE